MAVPNAGNEEETIGLAQYAAAVAAHPSLLLQSLGENVKEAAKAGNLQQLRILLTDKTGDELKEAVDTVGKRNLEEKTKRRLPLHLAVENGHADCAKYLIEKGADVKKEEERSKRLPLHWAAEKGHAECARVLIEAGADVNKEDYYQKSPLQLATHHRHIECARILVEAGADIISLSKGKQVSLATMLGNAKGLQALVADLTGDELIAAVNEEYDNKKSPLYYASSDGQLECTRVLLGAGADSSKLMVRFWVERGEAPTLRELLSMVSTDKLRQAVNAADDVGRTAAYIAATHQKVKRYGEQGMVNNECLDVLIFEYGALYLSKSDARLTQKEKLTRLVEFNVAAIIIVGGVYGYLSTGNVTTTCDTAFDGMLLQPYLFDFVSVFVFKIIQYAFEGLLLPVLDYSMFVSDCWLDERSPCYRAMKRRMKATTACLTGVCCCTSMRGKIAADENNSSSTQISRDAKVKEAGGDVELGHSDKKVSRLPNSSLSTIAAITKRWRKIKYLAVEKVDPDYHPIGDDYYDPSKRDFWYQVPFLFLYLQTCTALISIIVAAIHVDRSLPAWQQYTNFFAVVVNSGVSTQVFSSMKMILMDGRMKQIATLPTLIKIFVFIPQYLLLVPGLTHMLPATLIYCWISLLLISLLSVPYTTLLLEKFDDSRFEKLSDKIERITWMSKNFVKYHFDFYFEVVGRFVFIFVTQSLFTYAALFYELPQPVSGPDYIGVVTRDWHLRSQSLCFINEAATSSRGLVTLFSWF